MLAETREGLTLAQLETRTATYWQRKDHLDAIDANLKREYPQSFVYGTYLPTDEPNVSNRSDLTAGYYIIALSNRRKAGKYQIIAARQ
jgi:hypothetical protein